MKNIKRVIRFLFLKSDFYERRKSIREANSITIASYQLDTYKRVCPGKKIFFIPHFISTLENYNLLLEQKKAHKRIICDNIGAKDFMFSSTRHFWKGIHKFQSDNKGNDIMLQAFATYLKLSNTYNTKLILIEKGVDVKASKALARELKIDKFIIWEKEMPRRKLDKYYQGATFCFGQFGTPVLSFASEEPLAHGTPCFSFYRVKEGVPYYIELPPIIKSKKPDDIAKKMYEMITQEEYYSELCYKSWKWVKENCSEEKFIEAFLNIFQSH